jgi:hypothetical protein
MVKHNTHQQAVRPCECAEVVRHNIQQLIDWEGVHVDTCALKSLQTNTSTHRNMRCSLGVFSMLHTSHC